MKHLDMFTGIGGMTLAVMPVSSPVGYCDRKLQSQVLLHQLIKNGQISNKPIVSEADEVAKHFSKDSVDMITAGFPCTGFSICGKRERFEHSESRAFGCLLRACRHFQPKLVFLENSPLVYDNINTRERVEKAFRRQGYNMIHCKVRATDVGLPHVRNRWFAVAHNNSLDKLQSGRISANLKVKGPYKEPKRTTLVKQLDVCNRFDLLKNAVIPGCATLALKTMLHAHSKGTISGEVMCNCKTLKPLGLIIKSGSQCFHKQYWPTLHGSWRRGAANITERSIRDIHTAVKYETKTVPGYVSVEWLEWLMGFPKAWTSAH